MKKNPVPFLSKVGWAENISLIVLFAIAMPLKYMFDMPLAVRIVGSLHGILFVFFSLVLLRTWVVAKWPFGRVFLVFLFDAFIPFGPAFIGRKMKAYEQEFASGAIPVAPTVAVR